MKNQQNTPPIAKKVHHELSVHGISRTDNYFWMRLSDEQKEAKVPDEQTKAVVDYLNTENLYLKTELQHPDQLQEQLFQEITARIEQKMESVPVVKNGFSYHVKYEEGEDYPIHLRKSISELNAKEEILINGPELAKDKAYFDIGNYVISPDNKKMVYSIDTFSRRQYTLYVKDLETGLLLTDLIPNTTGNAVWANDNETVFYTRKDPITLRSNQVFKHKLGDRPEQDELVFEETDETFWCEVKKSKSNAYIFIESVNSISSEFRCIPAESPNQEWQVIQKRERGLEYSVEHFGDFFYILTNLNAKNFKLVKTPINSTSKETWEDVIPYREEVLLEGMEIFNDYLVIEERINGLGQLRVRNWKNGAEYYIPFNDPTYMVYTFHNPEFNTNTLRFAYSSLTTPYSVYDFNMDTQQRELKKQTKVEDPNFKTKNYKAERLYAVANDGTKIPISLVYKKELKLNGPQPLLLYGYGSYGSSMDAYFSSVRLSLLDRGFIFAIAHVRGGQELGRTWYEEGKLLNKMNTFTDFISCAEFLIAENYTDSNRLYAQGGSAGGLLMGAIMNMRPDLWKGILAGVPFVDVISTMLDESIPLTTGEFDEWGNPKDKKFYDYIAQYSPYDNISAKNYPHLLITTGYWDSQVQYWEPAKWIAKLREYNQSENRLLMFCNMDVGHGGASGRFEQYKEVALEYAFLLDLEGIKE